MILLIKAGWKGDAARNGTVGSPLKNKRRSVNGRRNAATNYNRNDMK